MGLFGPSKKELELQKQNDNLKQKIKEIEKRQIDEMVKRYENFLKEKESAFKWLAGMIVDLLEIAKEDYKRNSYSQNYDYSKLKRLFDNNELVRRNMELKYELQYLKKIPEKEAHGIIKDEEINKRKAELEKLKKEYDLVYLKIRDIEKKVDELKKHKQVIKYGNDLDRIETRKVQLEKEYALIKKAIEPFDIARDKIKLIESFSYKIDVLEKSHKEIISEILSHKDMILKYAIESADNILLEKAKTYRWMASIIADFNTTIEKKFIDDVLDKYSILKSNKVVKIDILREQKRELIEKNKILEYEINYLKELIPENDDIIEYEDDINITEKDNKQSYYLSKEDYIKLNDIEKSKRALEYYYSKQKSKWEIGRDFERCIGWKYEQQGYNVIYYGIEQKLSDLGRDLIAENEKEILIIQCKYWGKDKSGQFKLIREKHIMQLFGTTYKYKLENKNSNKNIIGLFITHSELSETAKEFAKALSVQVIEHAEFEKCPMIKCNIGKNGEKIYHLPMDQQYNSTVINYKNGERYALTVEEAEELGFRRAHKWGQWENL